MLRRGQRLCYFPIQRKKHGLTYDGIPQVNMDQLNPRRSFQDIPLPYGVTSPEVLKVLDGDLYNWVTVVMILTRGILLKTEDWDQWQL